METENLVIDVQTGQSHIYTSYLYAKIEADNMLVYAPIDYMTPDNKMIYNFNSDKALMEKYGFKEVIDVIPSYDSTTQEVEFGGYIDTETAITVQYHIVPKPQEPLILEEQIAMLQKQMLNIINAGMLDSLSSK